MNARVAAVSLCANRPLAALVVANGVSAIGDWLYLTAIPLLIFRETHDAALVGLVAATRLLPWLMLSMPAGAIADRVAPARLLLVAETARALLMVVMTGLLLVEAPLWSVFLVALAAVGAGTFAMPAQGTIIPCLSRDDAELGAANVVSSTLDNIACVVGPALAGALIALGGLEVAFALNGASFLAVVAILAMIVRHARPTPSARLPEDPGKHDPTAAVGWVAIGRAAIRPLTMDAAVSVAAGSMSIVPVLVVASMPTANDALVGVLSTAAGVGGLLGAIAAGAFVNDRPRQGLAVGVAVSVVGFALLAAEQSPLVAGLAVALVAGAAVQLDTLNTTELQRSTPRDRLGRTFGLLQSLAAGWVMAGSIMAGVIGQTFGAGAAVVACGGIVAALGCGALIRRPVQAQAARPTVPVAGNA